MFVMIVPKARSAAPIAPTRPMRTAWSEATSSHRALTASAPVRPRLVVGTDGNGDTSNTAIVPKP